VCGRYDDEEVVVLRCCDLDVLGAAERLEKGRHRVAVPDDKDDVAGMLGFQAGGERSKIRLAVGAGRRVLPDGDLQRSRERPGGLQGPDEVSRVDRGDARVLQEGGEPHGPRAPRLRKRNAGVVRVRLLLGVPHDEDRPLRGRGLSCEGRGRHREDAQGNPTHGENSTISAAYEVTIDGIAGSIDVTGQNDAVDVKRLAAGACQEVTVKTSFAPIRIAIPDGAGYTVNARTSFGKVRTDVPVESTGTLSGEGLSGKIGNGRCKMTLTNNNGNIELVKGK
jgi:hypothetical protein